MQRTPISPADVFSLNMLAAPLARFEAPGGPFDPHGDWQAAYGVYTLATIQAGPVRAGRVGSLRLRRKALAAGDFALSVQYEKGLLAGCRQRVVGEIHCRADRLATPRRWDFAAETLDASDRTIPETVLEKSASVSGGHIEWNDGRSRRRIPAPVAFTVNWALFEAVGRLPDSDFEPATFTLLDHFDQVKSGQRLSYRQSVWLRIGREESAPQPIRLRAYDQLGRGIVPWVYWVDGQGRLLAAVAGLEAYLWEPYQPS